jgi:hypothetical protein
MVVDLAEYIIDWIVGYAALDEDCTLTVDPEVIFEGGCYLAYKHPEKGVIWKRDEEFEYCGLDDRKGNFVYLRFKDDEEITYNPVDKFASCLLGTQVQVSLRLVSVIDNMIITTGREHYEVEEYLRNILLTIPWQNYTGNEENIYLELTRSLFNPITVLAEEGVKKTMAKNKIYTVFDMTLRYTYSPEIKDKNGV